MKEFVKHEEYKNRGAGKRLEKIRDRHTEENYDLLKNNCHHFARDIIENGFGKKERN